MMQRLLIAGMLSGLVVAVAAFAFARVFSEPSIELAIMLEEAGEGHGHSHLEASEEGTVVSRAAQRNLGLLVGIASYSVALGGVLAIGTAAMRGRTQCSTRGTVLLLSGCGYVALVLIPALKYPANPPGIGSAETIGARTQLYFLLLLVSTAYMAIAAILAARVRAGGSSRASSLASGGVLYGTLALTTIWMMPALREVPVDFPKGLLLEFRVNAALLQVVIWGGLGLVFGKLAAVVVGDDTGRNASRGIPNA